MDIYISRTHLVDADCHKPPENVWSDAYWSRAHSRRAPFVLICHRSICGMVGFMKILKNNSLISIPKVDWNVCWWAEAHTHDSRSANRILLDEEAPSRCHGKVCERKYIKFIKLFSFFFLIFKFLMSWIRFVLPNRKYVRIPKTVKPPHETESEEVKKKAMDIVDRKIDFCQDWHSLFHCNGISYSYKDIYVLTNWHLFGSTRRTKQKSKTRKSKKVRKKNLQRNIHWTPPLSLLSQIHFSTHVLSYISHIHTHTPTHTLLHTQTHLNHPLSRKPRLHKPLQSLDSPLQLLSLRDLLLKLLLKILHCIIFRWNKCQRGRWSHSRRERRCGPASARRITSRRGHVLELTRRERPSDCGKRRRENGRTWGNRSGSGSGGRIDDGGGLVQWRWPLDRRKERSTGALNFWSSFWGGQNWHGYGGLIGDHELHHAALRRVVTGHIEDVAYEKVRE